MGHDLQKAKSIWAIAGHHKATFLAVFLAMDQQTAETFFLAYKYFRWLDDLVDSDSLSLAEKLSLLDCQKNSISQRYANPPQAEFLAPHTEEEECLWRVIAYDIAARQGALKEPIWGMLTSLELDVRRRGKRLLARDLNLIQEYRTRAYSQGILALFYGRPIAIEDDRLYSFGLACDEAHKLRDMLVDIAFGYNNIAEEEIVEFGLEPIDPGRPAFRQYIKHKVNATKEKFKLSRRATRQVPLVLRMACWIYGFRHELVLDIIEIDGFRLRSKYLLSLPSMFRFHMERLARSWRKSQSLAPDLPSNL